MRHLDFSAKYSNQTKLSDLKEMILTQLLLSLNRIQLLPIIKKNRQFQSIWSRLYSFWFHLLYYWHRFETEQNDWSISLEWRHL